MVFIGSSGTYADVDAIQIYADPVSTLVSQYGFISELQELDYSGFEVWIIFLSLAIVRRFLFRSS